MATATSDPSPWADYFPWTQTHSGRAFPLVDPEPDDVRWPDVIYALAHINRFTGHVGVYSVAQHSVLVGDQLPAEWRLYGYIHDCHEFVIGDISTPVKRALELMYGADLWSLVDGVDRALLLAAGLMYPVPKTIADAVKVADIRALMTERRDLYPRPPPKGWSAELERVLPLPEKIIPWTPQQSIARYALALESAGLPIGPCISVCA